MNLDKDVQNNIKKYYPCGKVKVSIKHINKIAEIEKYLKQNVEISKNRTMYDLQWAFKDSQKRINLFFEESLHEIIQILNTLKKEDPFFYKELIHLKQINKHHKKALNRNVQSYQIASFLISFIDIIISMILIVLISQISHIGQAFFSSAILGTLFIAIIALLKVSLDRKYIIPKVHKLGWKWYKKININFEKNMALLISTSIIITELIKKKDLLELKRIVDKIDHELDLRTK